MTKCKASSSESPPYFTAFMASVFILLASSSSSELNETRTLFCAMIVPLCGIASITSYLYCHQSENVEAPAPCFASISATLYPSRTCWNVAILKPKSSATLVSIKISSCLYEWQCSSLFPSKISANASSSRSILGGTFFLWAFELRL